MNQKLYDILSYVGRIVLPAIAAFMISLGEVWAIPHYQEIAATITIVATLINAILKIDSVEYFKDKDVE